MTQEPGRDIWRHMLPGLGLVVLMGVLACLCWVSWHRWTDPLVDSGVELYTAWQLAEGRTLYRDVAHLHGPLSACLNALILRYGGVAYRTLAYAQVVLLGVFTVFLYWVWRRLAGTWGAVCVGLGFLVVSAFGIYTGDLGSHNFITPYVHEGIHGLYLSTVMLVVVSAHARRPGLSLRILAGVLYGLVFLTKSEVFLALNVALLAYGMTEWTTGGRKSGRLVALGSWCVAGLVVVAAAGYVAMPGDLPVRDYLAGISRQYILGFAPGVRENTFFRSVMGLDRPLVHLLDMARAAAVVSLVFLILHALVRWGVSRRERGQRGGVTAMGIGGGGLAVALWFWDWHYLACLLPVALAVAAIHTWREARACGDEADSVRFSALDWMLGLGFGLGMLIKSGLNPVFGHYGFLLSAVGLMCLIGMGTSRIPDLYPPARRLPMRIGLTMLLLTGVLRLGMESWHNFSLCTASVGVRREDRFLVAPPDLDGRGQILNALEDWVSTNLPPSATVLVLPEGAMLNYLTRRANPTPFTNFMVAEIAAFGVDRMLASFQAHPADCVIFWDRDMEEYGFRAFDLHGGPGERLMKWVTDRYVPVHQVSRIPYVMIYRRAGSPGPR